MTEQLSELGQHLQQHLGAAYALERELRGGGMSRVFVGTDRALGRQVVVKVLPPGLAATVSIERFKREIMLSAGLQHAHIVPVLSAGEVDGLPYFIMPFIAGESLRARITRGPLSVRETVTVMKDVARALAYAHGRGIVHRDIKPDNILLSAGSAVVTDFGVAKALVASRERASLPVGGTITGIGISLGTPQYMAPEQAAADPNADHRADLYALGIVAYEMLVGAPPFHGRTPQALLAAQLTELPVPISSRRYDVSAPLSDLIMRCLEKVPDNRPRNADDMVRALDDPEVISGTFTPATVRLRRRSKRALIVAACVVVMIVTAGVVWRLSSAGDTATPSAAPFIPQSARSIAVLPLQSLGRDRADSNTAAGISSALTNAIARVPGMRVASQTATNAARSQLRTLPDIARTLQVGMLVEGTVQRQRDQLRVDLRLIDVTSDSTLWAGTFDGSATDVFKLQDDVTRGLTAALVARSLPVPTR
jgi:serine/threonine protein kinase